METNKIGNQQVSRTGNFTSSAISALCSNGRAKGTFKKPFIFSILVAISIDFWHGKRIGIGKAFLSFKVKS